MHYKKVALPIVMAALPVVFACQPDPWRIPVSLEIESEHLTPEQASVALFGAYDRERRESTWNMRRNREFFEQFKDHEFVVAPDRDIVLTTQYRAADVSQKDYVSLLYTTTFGYMEEIEDSQAYGVISVFEFKKSDSTWKLIQQSHMVLALAYGHYESLDAGYEVGKPVIGKNNNAFDIYTPGGGIAGVYHGHSHLIARVGQAYSIVFTYATHDSYCPYSYHESSDPLEAESCSGMEASIDILECDQEFCPIRLTVEGRTGPNLGEEEFVPGIYRFNGREYVR